MFIEINGKFGFPIIVNTNFINTINKSQSSDTGKFLIYIHFLDRISPTVESNSLDMEFGSVEERDKKYQELKGLLGVYSLVTNEEPEGSQNEAFITVIE